MTSRVDVRGPLADLTVPASTIVGRAATGGIAALTAAQTRTVLGTMSTDEYRQRWLQPTGNSLDLLPRDLCSSAYAISASGYTTLSSFYVPTSVTFTTISMATGATAAAATPTLCRFGIYSSTDGATWTLVCAVANDVTLFAATNTLYTRALDTGGSLPDTYTCVPGTLYALGVLVVTAGALPTLVAGPGVAMPPAVSGLAPTMAVHKSGQTDLVASLTSVTTTARRYWGRLA